jgi:thiol:disulfide interchange protein DsbD
MSIGMSMPLLLIGFSANKLLPKPGIWMIKVKKLLGFILIGMAIYIIRPMLSESIFYFLLNTLLTSTFIYYLFFTKNKIALIKIVLITSFLLSLFSNIFLAENLLDKDKDLISFKSKPNFIVINTVDELNNLISTNNKKPIMLDFYADWCITCLEFEKFTFTNEQVRALMNEYVLLKVDVTNNTESHKKLMREFEIFGPPAIIFFNSSGSEIRRIRTIGFKNAKDFKKILRIGLKHEKEF